MARLRASINYDHKNSGGTDQIERMRQFVREARPTSFLVMDGLDFAGELARDYPDTIIIHRKYYARNGVDEANFHKHWTPSQFADVATENGRLDKRVWVYVMNEPGYDKTLADWLLRTADELWRRGYKSVIGNIGPSTIPFWQLENGDLLPYLKGLADRSEYTIGGWHEYIAPHPLISVGLLSQMGARTYNIPPSGWPTDFPAVRLPSDQVRMIDGVMTTLPGYWHFPRVHLLDIICDDNNIPRHRKLITEHGVDKLPDLTYAQDNIYTWINSFSGCGIYHTIRGQLSCTEYWLRLWGMAFPEAFLAINKWQNQVYNDTVVGWNTFTHAFGNLNGTSGSEWDFAWCFNLGREPRYYTLLIGWAKELANVPNEDNDGMLTAKTTTGLNFRTKPTIDALTKITGIPAGATIQWNPNKRTVGPNVDGQVAYEWVEAIYSGQTGWLAVTANNVSGYWITPYQPGSASDYIDYADAVSENPPPDTSDLIADFSYSIQGEQATFVQFTNLSEGDEPLTYLWEFGDGETSDYIHPGHTYEYGTYQTRLTVTDAHGTIKNTAETITIEAPPPGLGSIWLSGDEIQELINQDQGVLNGFNAVANDIEMTITNLTSLRQHMMEISEHIQNRITILQTALERVNEPQD